MTEIPLADLVHVFAGTNEKPVERGCPLLFPSDINAFGRLLSPPRRYAPQSPSAEKACLEPEDVLLPAKGLRFLATLVTEELAGCVVSSGYYILRPRGRDLLPAYLTAYLNHPEGQRRLLAHVHASTTVPVLNKADLLATRVPVPSPIQQKELARLCALYQQEAMLAQELLHQKELLYHQGFKRGLVRAPQFTAA